MGGKGRISLLVERFFAANGEQCVVKSLNKSLRDFADLMTSDCSDVFPPRLLPFCLVAFRADTSSRGRILLALGITV